MSRHIITVKKAVLQDIMPNVFTPVSGWDTLTLLLDKYAEFKDPDLITPHQLKLIVFGVVKTDHEILTVIKEGKPFSALGIQ
jgi:hypothetical protein